MTPIDLLGCQAVKGVDSIDSFDSFFLCGFDTLRDMLLWKH